MENLGGLGYSGQGLQEMSDLNAQYASAEGQGNDTTMSMLQYIAAVVGPANAEAALQIVLTNDPATAKQELIRQGLVTTENGANAVIYAASKGSDASSSLRNYPYTEGQAKTTEAQKTEWDNFIDEYFATARTAYENEAAANRKYAEEFIGSQRGVEGELSEYQNILNENLSRAEPISFGFKGGRKLGGDIMTRQSRDIVKMLDDISLQKSGLYNTILGAQTGILNPELGHIKYLEKSQNVERLRQLGIISDAQAQQLLAWIKQSQEPDVLGGIGKILGIGTDIAGLGGISGIFKSIFG